MRICKNCGFHAEHQEKFCPRCGDEIAEIKEKTGELDRRNDKKKNILTVLMAFLATLFAAGLIIAGFYLFSDILDGNEKIAAPADEIKEVENTDVQESRDAAETDGAAQVEDSADNYLALVRNQEGKYGFINDKGEEVIECQYDIAYPFSKRGLAAVGYSRADEQSWPYYYTWGYINREGEEVIQPQYDAVTSYGFEENGLAAVARQEGTDDQGFPQYFWGFINEDGKEMTPFKYLDYGYSYDGSSFHDWSNEGLMAVAVMGDDSLFRCGYINENGDEVVPLEYISVDSTPSDNGIYPVQKELDGKWGYINSRNEVVIPFIYDQAYHFSNGLASVTNEDFCCGYIDSNNNTVIPFEYFTGDALSERDRISVTNQDNLSGCIDRSGRVVIPLQYSSVGLLDGGNYFAVSYGEMDDEMRHGLLDADGNTILECRFRTMEELEAGGKSWGVKISEGNINALKYGIADYDGNMIVSTKYDYVGACGDNGWVAVAQINGEMPEDGGSYDSSKSYSVKYVDMAGGSGLVLPEGYTYGGEFVNVSVSNTGGKQQSAPVGKTEEHVGSIAAENTVDEFTADEAQEAVKAYILENDPGAQFYFNHNDETDEKYYIWTTYRVTGGKTAFVIERKTGETYEYGPFNAVDENPEEADVNKDYVFNVYSYLD